MSADLVLTKQQSIGLSAAEQALICGNLANLSDVQRLELYGRVCDSLGLNPLTKPFDYIILNNKMTLYAKRDCTDQLRRLHGVSIVDLTDNTVGDVYIVKAKATTKDGRSDTSTGAVSIKNLQGEALANALMKAETKAKRRATLSICGLGFLDETEAESLVQSGTAHVQATAVVQSSPVQQNGHVSAEDAAIDEVAQAAEEEASRRKAEEVKAEEEAIAERKRIRNVAFRAFAKTALDCGFVGQGKDAVLLLARLVCRKEEPDAQDWDNARKLRTADWNAAIDQAHEELGITGKTAPEPPQEDAA